MTNDKEGDTPGPVRSPVTSCRGSGRAPIPASHYSRSLAEGTGIDFAYKKKRYLIGRDGDRWEVRRFNTRSDHRHNRYEVISERFSDPLTLIKTVRIGGIAIEDIFKFHQDDRIDFDRKYDYGILMKDLLSGAEVEFSYRNVPYTLLNRATGWEFSGGHKLIATHKDVRELVKMIRIEGLTLREIFDRHYKNDNTGDLVLDALSHSLSDEE